MIIQCVIYHTHRFPVWTSVDHAWTQNEEPRAEVPQVEAFCTPRVCGNPQTSPLHFLSHFH